ncbi:hypothetical protein LguiA_016216 [Lonicera macranthoides]
MTVIKAKEMHGEVVINEEKGDNKRELKEGRKGFQECSPAVHYHIPLKQPSCEGPYPPCAKSSPLIAASKPYALLRWLLCETLTSNMISRKMPDLLVNHPTVLKLKKECESE